MAITKIQSESLNLADTYAFTGTVTGAGQTNQPAFEAKLTSGQDINNNTATKVQFNGEVFDTDNCYDNSTNYRFTPNVAGKYFVYFKTYNDETAGNMRLMVGYLKKNGSTISYSVMNFHSSLSDDAEGGTINHTSIVDMNGSSDYLEVFQLNDLVSGSGTSEVTGSSIDAPTIFGAYKLF